MSQHSLLVAGPEGFRDKPAAGAWRRMAEALPFEVTGAPDAERAVRREVLGVALDRHHVDRLRLVRVDIEPVAMGGVVDVSLWAEMLSPGTLDMIVSDLADIVFADPEDFLI